MGHHRPGMAEARDKHSKAEFQLWLGRQPVLTYGLTLGLVILVFLLRAALAPTLGNQALYLFLVPPVVIAGILGGWGPGLLATTTAALLQILNTRSLRRRSARKRRWRAKPICNRSSTPSQRP
jgi:hypothetical protein